MTQQPDDPAAADDEPSSTEPAPLKNTLYRKVTRGKRKLTRGRLLAVPRRRGHRVVGRARPLGELPHHARGRQGNRRSRPFAT